jgi:cell division septal protein FtsQ
LAIVRTRQQRRRAIRTLIIRLFTTVMLGFMMYAAYEMYDVLTTSERFAVRAVEIRGLCRVDSVEVGKLVAGIQGENIFLLPLEKCAERFSAHPRVRSITFKKVLPNKVYCAVEEREPVAVVYAGGFFEVDQEGMVLTSDELTDYLDLPIISGVERKTLKQGTFCKDPQLSNALGVLGICKRIGGTFADDVSEVRIGSQGISVVTLKEGTVLLLGQDEFEGRLKKFFLIRGTLAKRGETSKLIDLRFDDQVVLRSGI